MPRLVNTRDEQPRPVTVTPQSLEFVDNCPPTNP
jgi:hypothetical protein